MHLVEYYHGHSLIHRLDPRLRVVVALLWAGLAALAQGWPVILTSLALGLGLALWAGLGPRSLLGRLKELNLFLLLVLVFIPLTTPGRPLLAWGPLAFTAEGLLFGLAIAAKGNAIVLILTALLATVEPVTLGHALSHLRVPAKLIQLFLFTVRYVDVLHHEYWRLTTALKARCFRSGLNRHAYRTLAHLAAILLVRSADRSERIVQAMKCRGFQGRFYVLDHFQAHRRDALFGLAALALAAGLVYLEAA
jgi:cobalt/nickel transport system permease protein